MTHPTWLPPPLILNPIPKDIYDILSGIFKRDFVPGSVRYKGTPVWWNARINNGYQESFWHLISKDDPIVHERILDTRRAEKLPWCVPIILNYDKPELTTFNYLEGDGRVKTYVWLEQHDYVVILEKCRKKFRSELIDVMWLITAHNVDGENTRRKLRRKREKSL